MAFLSSWRTALRVARREARAHRGRSALVAALIGLPVVALSFAAASYDMFTLTGVERADRAMGAADARIEWPSHRATMQLPDPDEGWQLAGADLGAGLVRGEPGEPVEIDERDRPGTEAELRAALPGATLLPVRRGGAVVTTPNGQTRMDAVMVDATSPLVRGYVTVLEGRAPTAGTEVALTEHAMVWLETGIGGTISVPTASGERVYTVVGRIEFPSQLDEVLLFAYDGDDAAAGQWFESHEGNSWLVDTAAPITWNHVLELNDHGMVVASRTVFEYPPPDEQVPLKQYWYSQRFIDTEQLGAGVLVAGLALLEVVLLAGPAFAVSARRRQRQLALVAANGGTGAHIRRIVLADGVVLGLLGAGVGIAVGVAAAFAARPWVEESIAHIRAGGYRVFPEALMAITALAVVTGLAAALVPAFVTARQSVVAALAGRRGAIRSRTRWVSLGIAMIGMGILTTGVGALQADATVVLVGLVLGELGVVVCTPAIVGLVARLGRLLPLAPRVALRDAARNRAATAPAVSAVMAAVAGSVALGMFFVSYEEFDRRQYWDFRPAGGVEVHAEGWRNPETAAALEQAMRGTLPIDELHRVGSVVCPDGPDLGRWCVIAATQNDLCPELADLAAAWQLPEAQRRAAGANPYCDVRNVYVGRSDFLVDAGAAIAAITGASGDDVRRAQQTLAAGGVVVRSPLLITDGQVTLQAMVPDPDAPGGQLIDFGDFGRFEVPPGHAVTTVTVPGYLLTGTGPGTSIISAAAVQRLGLAVAEYTVLATTTRTPTRAEQERFYAAMSGLQAGGNIYLPFQSETDVRLLILMAAAALITIGAAAVGTGLAAADGRADLSTLAAVGASPRLRRGLSLSQSGVIAGLGSVLGAVAGLGAAYAAITASNHANDRLWPADGPVHAILPWTLLLVTLVAVPGIATLGAGLFIRSRLPIERRL